MTPAIKIFCRAFARGCAEAPAGFFAPLLGAWRLGRQVLQITH